jgi:cytochrome c oxidase subunit 3
MSTATLSHDAHDAHAGHASAPPHVAKFGMIMFLSSEAMLFAGLIGGYIVLRLSHGVAWPPPGAIDIGVQWPLTTMNIVMIVNSFILIGSSFLFHFAEVAIKKHGKSGLPWLIATIVAGSVFLGVQAWEWVHLHHEGLWFDTHGIYGSCFFVMTGFHGMHVLVGVCLIVWVFLRQLFLKCYKPGQTASLDNVGLYWHFVDVVWIFLYTILYVI